MVNPLKWLKFSVHLVSSSHVHHFWLSLITLQYPTNTHTLPIIELISLRHLVELLTHIWQWYTIIFENNLPKKIQRTILFLTHLKCCLSLWIMRNITNGCFRLNKFWAKNLNHRRINDEISLMFDAMLLIKGLRIKFY